MSEGNQNRRSKPRHPRKSMVSRGRRRSLPAVSYAERNRLGDAASVEPNWIKPAECIVIFDLLLVQHGGVPGFRDEAALGAALAVSLRVHRQYTGTIQAVHSLSMPVYSP
jgi:hypothetical protein